MLRPPLAQERLRLLGDGRVLVELKRPWSDGTSHLLFEPLELLEKLAALTARPRINLILYHGALAPHARWRNRIVPEPAAETLAPGANPEGNGAACVDDRPGPPRPRRRWRWADLMRRAFDIDVLACRPCGNRMRLLATIEDPRAAPRPGRVPRTAFMSPSLETVFVASIPPPRGASPAGGGGRPGSVPGLR